MTAKRQALLDLAARVEGLDGPSREVDAAIKQALFAPSGFVRQSSINGNWCIYETGYNGKERLVERPRAMRHEDWQNDKYTASLDAAMQLVPAGWCKTVADYWCYGKETPPYFADCGDLEALKAEKKDAIIVEAFANTPATALTAAALRARAMMEEE